MTSDQESDRAASQEQPSTGIDLAALTDEVNALVNQRTKLSGEERDAVTRQLEDLHQNQYQMLVDTGRAGFLDHPRVSVLKDRYSDPPIYQQANAIVTLAYFNSLPLSEVDNPVFPGYQNGVFTGADDIPALRSRLRKQVNTIREKLEYRDNLERYEELKGQLLESGRGVLLEHPAVELAETALNPENRRTIKNAIEVFEYFQTLPAEEAHNTVFPGHTEGYAFAGVDEDSEAAKSLRTALNDARDEAKAVFRDPDIGETQSLFDLEYPEYDPADPTEKQLYDDIRAYTGQDGLVKIDEMRRQLLEDGSINPYQFVAMNLSWMQTVMTLSRMAEAITGEDIDLGELEEVVDKLSLNGTIVDADVSIAELAELNDLHPQEVEAMLAETQIFLTAGSMVTDVQTLMRHEGFLGWLVKNWREFENVGNPLEGDADAIALLEDVPGMTPERLQYHLDNARIFDIADAYEEAGDDGLNMEDYRALQVDPNALLIRYVADHAKGITPQPEEAPGQDNQTAPASPHLVPENSAGTGPVPEQTDTEAGLTFDNSFQFRLIPTPRHEGEHVSAGLFTRPEGDGLRYGLDLSGGEVLPEAYWRFNMDDVGGHDLGRLEAGLLGFQLGDFDETPGSVSQPWLRNIFHNESMVGARLSRAFEFNNGGRLDTELSAGNSLDIDLFDLSVDIEPDLLLQGRAIFEQPLSDRFSVRLGGAASHFDSRTRLDYFGEGSHTLNENSDWRFGVQGAQGLGYAYDNYARGYTQLRLGTGQTGNWWTSNLTTVFGASADIYDPHDINSDYEVHLDLLKAVGLNSIGNGNFDLGGFLDSANVGVGVYHNDREDVGVRFMIQFPH